jgi:hypothetical protein
MATAFRAGQVLRRAIKVYGVEGTVLADFDADGVTFKVLGSRTEVRLPWRAAVEASTTPDNVKSYDAGKPLQVLQHAAEGLVQRRTKRLTKKIQEEIKEAR